MIKVEKLNFSYNSEKVLKNINLVIPNGNVVFLLGPNGSGKTTFLKCIGGILNPEGVVYLEKIDLRKLSNKELSKIFGYVAQRGELNYLTVFDVILLGRKPYIDWKPKDEDYQIVEEVVEFFDLKELVTRKLTQLSGGELQLVLIARAFAQKPKYILLDEPTNNLDIKNQVKLMSILREAVKKSGLTAIITTHELNLAANFADNIILIRDGQIYAHGGVEILTKENINRVYGVDVEIIKVKDKLAIMVFN